MTAPESTTEWPLFVYGTLLDEKFTSNLLERPVTSETARLLDFEFVRLEMIDYLAAVYAPGGSIDGRLYRHLNDQDYIRLDAYEGVNEGLYRRVEAVTVAGGKWKTPPEKTFVYAATEKTLRRYGAL